eukprot:jgi/Orpsp1_1/1182193/evm.model.c7180000080276.1
MYNIEELTPQRKYFIETDRENANLWQWLSSKGTNYTCFENHKLSMGDEEILNDKISVIRKIVYALHSPVQFLFFYWTILIFILHKFNFKKPVMKIILGHFVIRATGSVLDKFGQLLATYYINVKTTDEYGDTFSCKKDGNMHPLRWFLTRQIGTVFWYCGEIIADWYPLLRSHAVVKNRSIWLVYFTCGLFNASKIALIILHWTLSPTQLYDKDGVYELERVNKFYFTYWMIQLIIIYASFLYDFSVYYVLRKNIFLGPQSDTGFLKKFKTISVYRLYVSALVSAIFLPIVSITIIIKYYYYFKYNYTNLDFSFDEIRQSIANVQYYMIFIDQILLITSNRKCSRVTTSSSFSISSNYHAKESSSNSKAILKYNTQNHNMTLTNSIPDSPMEYTYTGYPVDSVLNKYQSNSNSLKRNNYKFGTINSVRNNSFTGNDTYSANNGNKDDLFNDYHTNSKWNYLK